MSNMFYPKLAASNMKKNARLYVPYLLTCIATVMMYYIINALADNQSLEGTYGGSHVTYCLDFGSWVVCIFAVIFLFYTNSFLMKRRKKEFGLFNILGMEKRHISRIIFIETLYAALLSLGLGIGFGIFFSKLVELVLYNLLHFEIQMGIEISLPAVVRTLVLFAAIFLLILLNSLRQIHLSNPIELLRGGNVGEREPKAKWLLALIGFGCLGGGYYISLTTESPLEAMFLFFVAIVLVMIGTYCLFTAGSIVVLKLMKKNKKFYYQTRHFTSISGMIYRMKQNAVGLANICILSTGVLIMLSTTCSLYTGMEDLLRSRFPRNVQMQADAVTSQQIEAINEAADRAVQEQSLQQESRVSYRSVDLFVSREGDQFLWQGEKELSMGGNLVRFTCIPLEDYGTMGGETETLEPDEVLVYEANGHLNTDVIRMGQKEYKVKKLLDDLFTTNSQVDALTDTFYLIVPSLNTVSEMLTDGSGAEQEMPEVGYYLGFDLDVEPEIEKAVISRINESIESENLPFYVEGAEGSRDSFYSLYGSLLFLGIFLGLLFVIATVLIIYYKQITEGYEDKERFHIMQKVGMSKREVKGTIHSQVLAVFFLPLLMACVHTAFAYPVVKKILLMMNLSNTWIFVQTTLVTVAAFAVFYVLVYSLTAKAYYRIVSA